MTAFIHNNIEYVMPTVFKATMLDWAHDLIDDGTIYFTDIGLYDAVLSAGDYHSIFENT